MKYGIIFCVAVALMGCASQPNADKPRTRKPIENKLTPKQGTPIMSDTNTIVIIETDKGDITVELNGEKAPKTVANILAYVDAKYYDGLIFHRVIPGFMVQGGGMDANMQQKATNAAVENEADNGLLNDRGTLAMARTGDPHSATGQFFINHADNAFLNHSGKNPQGWGYCVFGKVTDGMDVVDAIAAVPTGNAGPHQDVPTEQVKIKTIRRK
jgi:peptidyl-prolyl cis-trans isomerase B (cyclophilin B)